MKKQVSILILALLAVLLVAGCASTIEPTSAPAQANPGVGGNPPSANNPPQVAPQAAPSPTIPSRPVGNCQSRIMGRVLDPGNNLIKGASLELKGSAIKGATPKTVSDDNGLYGFAGLCAGSYSFTVTMPNKKVSAVNTNVAVDGANSVKADLTVK